MMVADLLHRANYIEKMGTGIMKMKKLMTEANLSEPAFSSNSFFVTTFKRLPLYDNETGKRPENDRKIIAVRGELFGIRKKVSTEKRMDYSRSNIRNY